MDFSEADLTLAQIRAYIQAAITEHWSGTRIAAFAQFCLDVTETE